MGEAPLKEGDWLGQVEKKGKAKSGYLVDISDCFTALRLAPGMMDR